MCDSNVINRDYSQSCISSSTIFPHSLQECGNTTESYLELNYDELQPKLCLNQQQYNQQQTQLCLQQDYQEDNWNVDEYFNTTNSPKENQIQTTQQQFPNNYAYDQTAYTEVVLNKNPDVISNQYNCNNNNNNSSNINYNNTNNQNIYSNNYNNQQQYNSTFQNGTVVYSQSNQAENMKYEDAQIDNNYYYYQNQQIQQSNQFKNQLSNQQNQFHQIYQSQPNNQYYYQYNNNISNNQQCLQQNQQNYQQANSFYGQQVESPIYNQTIYQKPYKLSQVNLQDKDIICQQKVKPSYPQERKDIQLNQISQHSQSEISKQNNQKNQQPRQTNSAGSQYLSQSNQKSQQDISSQPTIAQTMQNQNSQDIRELQLEQKEVYQIENQNDQILLTTIKETTESTDSKSCSATLIDNTKESSETKQNLTQDSQVRQNIYKSIMNAFKIFLSQKQKICELFVHQEQLKIDNKLKQLARFLKTHSFNHQMLKYIALHDTYSVIFSHFINNECESWLQKSKIVKKDIAIGILNYLKQCVSDKTNFEEFVCYKTSKKSKKLKEYNFEDE